VVVYKNCGEGLTSPTRKIQTEKMNAPSLKKKDGNQEKWISRREKGLETLTVRGGNLK